MSATRLLKQLRAEKQKLEQSVIQGSPQDYAHYRFLVGKIHGMQSSIDICLNVLKELGEINE